MRFALIGHTGHWTTYQPILTAMPDLKTIQGEGKKTTSHGGNPFVYEEVAAGKPQTVKGVYALDGDTLAMEPESGGTMLAQVTQPQSGKFDFKLLGAPPDDPGLKFSKGS